MWADSLKTEEVSATLDAVTTLGNVAWAAPLLTRTASIVERLRVRLTDKDAYRANPITSTEMSFLFEIRFARAVADVGLTATYEYTAGVGNSAVDFRIELDVPWLVELVSLRESEAFKAATWTDGTFHGYLLRTDANDPRQSEEGETLKAQEKIGAKVFDRKQGAIKFPVPSGCVHMLLVDGRGFLGDGHGDAADWHQVIYGPAGLDPHLIKYWTNPKTGERAAIQGLFQPACPLPAARVAQQRLHVVGFVCEKNFGRNEITQQSIYFCNPALFETEQAARSAMAEWPLKPTSRPNDSSA